MSISASSARRTESDQNQGIYFMRLKWYGTATILIEQGGTQLLFDPFLSLNADTFKPPIDELSEAENILVTHGHLDHIVGIPKILHHSSGLAKVYCTASPRKTLISKGIEEAQIQPIAPGDVLIFEPFEVHILKGKHIVFDKRLIMKTFFSPRVLRNWSNFRYIMKENKNCSEAGETVIYDIRVGDERILLLGSLNLNENTEYLKGVDLLILPLQGRTDVSKYAMHIIDWLQPKKVLLDHFDDSFPPISSAVKTEQFVLLMKNEHPDVTVICPQASAAWIEVA